MHKEILFYYVLFAFLSVVLKSPSTLSLFYGADIPFNLEHVTVTGQNLLNATGDEVPYREMKT